MFGRQKSKCIICGKKTKPDKEKAGSEVFCRHCLSKLPIGARRHPEKISADVIKEFIEKAEEASGKKNDAEEMISFGSMIFYKRSRILYFSEAYFSVENISRITFSFLTRGKGYAPRPDGVIPVICTVYLKEPNILFKDMVADYPSYPLGTPWIFFMEQMGYRDYDKDRQTSWRSSGQYYHHNEKGSTGYAGGGYSHHRQSHASGHKQGNTAYHDALVLFMLKEPYTSAELKSRYRKLMKTFHPDNGEKGGEGENTELSAKINSAYQILKDRAQ
ncbi:MAG: DnaJ domain-containing protein [Clostridiales bacterium]|nr:DnaJ domain-containing protein [Clostridiales bacterium]